MTVEIAYVITDLELGGVPLHLHKLAVNMRARDRRIAVISLAVPGPVGARLRDEGFDVYTCDAASRWDLRVLPRLADFFRRLRPGIIHSFLFHANVASRWAAARVDILPDRIVCEIQTVEVERRWHLWVDRLSHDGCRFTIGNSPSVVEHLHWHAGIPRDRLRLVRGGIAPKRYAHIGRVKKSTLGLAEGDRMILWVGRLDPVKGLDALIKSVARLDRCHRAHLVLAGGGPMRGELERLVASNRAVDLVHFVGPRDDVPALLAACDVFAFPSRTEGLPNALLEAMAAGCPIVTTDVPGCRDLISHESNGLVVPFGDTKSLTTAIKRLLTNRDRAQELGMRAAITADTDWHVDAMFDAYARVYEEIDAPGSIGIDTTNGAGSDQSTK